MSDKMIRFITSDYKELFQIPDGGSIKITYPPGDGREPVTRACKYHDDYHFETLGRGGDIYHICQFAEIMERLDAKYEPEVQLRNVELTTFKPGEEKFYTYNREEGNTCVGHVAGDFGNDGERFHGGWYNHKTRAEKDWSDTSPEFQAELHSAVYALRYQYNFLKDYSSMRALCDACPEAKLDSGDNYQRYGFKLETDTRQYYTQCFFGENMRDARFIIYAYENPAPELDIFKPMGDWSMSKDYQGAESFIDGSRPLLAETSLADIVICGALDKNEVHIGVYPYGNLSDHYYEGHTAAKELAVQIGADIAKHIDANTDVQFTDGSFKQFFAGLQLSGVRMQDSMGEVSVQPDSAAQPAFGVVTPAAADESKMFYRNDAEGRLSVGYLRGDFGRGGNEFHHSWFDSDGGNKTPEFQAEFQTVMETLRQDVLKNLKSTQDFCYKHPEAQLPGDIHRYGFELETESYQYFVRCTVIPNDYFYVYAYDKAAAREQERQASDKPSQEHFEQHSKVEKFAKTSVREWYASAFTEDNEVAKNIHPDLTFGDVLRSPQKGDCAKDSVVRERVFTEMESQTQLPYDLFYYGWLNEIDSISEIAEKYFTGEQKLVIRDFVLDHTDIFVDPADRQDTHVQSAEIQERDKPSVLKQIRDAEKAPRKPRKAKTADKKKDGAEL